MLVSLMFRKLLPVLAAFIAALPLQSIAQGDPAQSPFGISSNWAYDGHGLDTINVLNGNLVIKIPLYSLPQRGKLKLNYVAVSNSNFWQQESDCPAFSAAICDNFPLNFGPGIAPYQGPDDFTFDNVCPAEGECNQVYVPGLGSTPNSPMGINVLRDTPGVSTFYSTAGFTETACGILVCGINIQSDDGSETQILSVQEVDGTSHSLLYDASYNAFDSSWSRTVDGSGYFFKSGTSPYNYPGVQNAGTPSILYQSDGTMLGAGPDMDPLGNQITYTGGTYISGTGLTNCPATPIGVVNQPTTGSDQWSVAGPNGGTSTFTICYAKIHIHTDLFGIAGQGFENDDDDPIYVENECIGDVYVIQSIVLPDGVSYYQFTYDSADPNASQSDSWPYIGYGSITSIHLPQGGRISYTYDNLINAFGEYTAEYGSSPRVFQRTVTDVSGNSNTWTYNGPGDVIDPAGNETIYTFQAPTFTTSLPATYPLTKTIYNGNGQGKTPLQKEQYVYNFAQAPGMLNVVGNALLMSTTTTLYDLQGNPAGSTTTSNTYDSGYFSADAIGSVNQPDTGPGTSQPCPEYCGGHSAGGLLSLGIPLTTTVTDYSGAIIKATRTTYSWQDSGSAYWTANILDAPSIVQEFDSGGVAGGNAVATTEFHYDESAYYSCATPLPGGSLTAGNLTTTKRWNPGGSDVSSHTTWDCYGFASKKTDGDGNSTTITPDTTEIFPQMVTRPPTNGVSHIDQYTYDPNTGNMLSHIDENGITTKYIYADPFGRITLSQAAFGLGASKERDVSYSYPSLAETDTSSDLNSKGDGALKSQVLFDGLGHTIFAKAPDGTVVQTAYDQFYKPCAVSNPTYTSSTQPSCTPATPSQTGTDGTTYYMRDALGRVTLQTNQDGSTKRWSYSGNSATFTDENQNATQRTSDALGRLTQVVEPGGLLTTYTYDALGNLACADQWGVATAAGTACTSGHARSFGYDPLSRLTGSTNPESGSISYTYDPNGNLVTKTSPVANVNSGTQTTYYSYDALNRLIQKGSPVLPVASSVKYSYSCYQYDQSSVSGASTAGNFVGHLTNSWSQISTTPSSSFTCPSSPPANGALTAHYILAYDEMGRPLSSQQCILSMCNSNGVPFQLSQSYDLAGDSKLVTQVPIAGVMPRLELAHYYDDAGRLRNIESSFDGTPNSNDPLNLFLVQSYSAAGLQDWMLGNNLNFKKTYDTRLRPTGEVVTHP